MSIKDATAQLDAVLDKIDAARALLNLAADLIDEATAFFGAAVAGTVASDALQALAWFGEAQQGIGSSFAALTAAEDAIRAYRTQLVGEPIATGPMVGETSPRENRSRSSGEPSTVPIAVTPERVEELRRQLPPPVVSSAGQKTHGRWIDPNGNVHQEVSGKDEKSEEALRFFEEEMKSRRIPVTVVDVEIKLAVHMRQQAMKSVTLVINNPPCRGPMGCSALIPVVLPPGYTMTVHGPDGFRQEYKGGGTSKWVP
ncbi:DddA-like double-stranded DNA deaminase toxin [Actinosynnema sp. NPDC023587]|uniref:DddA-like double-stranded DNA deaminase toxin n=1 Tax=Actinosynnema sp. NPDC023587 TaxID=3154695 RepID=UPI0033C0C536